MNSTTHNPPECTYNSLPDSIRFFSSGRDVTIVRTDNRMVLQGLGIQISEEDMCKGKLKGVQITAVANKR